MRVLIAHNHYRSGAPSGEDAVVEQESSGLRELGHEVELFERFSDDISRLNPLEQAFVPATALWGVRARRPFREAVRDFRPDVVHVHNLFPLISPAIFSVCAEAGVPVVATLHNYKLLCARGDMFREDSPCFECRDGSVGPALRHSCYHGSLPQTIPVVAGILKHRHAWRTLVAAYIAVSRAQLDQLAGAHLPEARAFVKPHFVPVHAEPCDQREHRVAYVGRLEEHKGIRVLMRAWEEFCATAPNSSLRLTLVGGGPLESEVQRWASVRPSVDVLGMLSRSDTMRILARSQCSVLPSLVRETFGLVALESMALGVPPVAADHGGFPEIVTSGVDGLLFDSRDPHSLARILQDVDRNPARFRALGVAARGTYEASYHPGPNLERLLDIYRFAISNPVATAQQAPNVPIQE